MLKIESGQRIELISEPELKDTSKGGKLWKGFGHDLSGGRRTYIGVVVFDEKLAKQLAKKTKAGSVIEVEGGVRSRQFEYKGQKRAAYEVDAESVKVVS
jgi:single-stranded DNA-binding protein